MTHYKLTHNPLSKTQYRSTHNLLLMTQHTCRSTHNQLFKKCCDGSPSAPMEAEPEERITITSGNEDDGPLPAPASSPEKPAPPPPPSSRSVRRLGLGRRAYRGHRR